MARLVDDALSRLQNKVKDKTGNLYRDINAVIPDSTVVEQASSEATAGFAASLISENETIADLTAGFGINSIYFSKVAKEVYAVERDETRALALIKNLELLGINNVRVINDDCFDWIKKQKVRIDNIFIDPSRRSVSGRKVFKLNDCSPNILELMPLLHDKCYKVFIKCSPLLDINDAIRQLPNLSEIFIVEYKRDVRELLLEIDFTKEGDENLPNLFCIILKQNGLRSVYDLSSERINKTIPRYLGSKDEITVDTYIYEPSPAFMKAGLWGTLIQEFPELKKLSANTHLFLSSKYYESFPGRSFRVVRMLGSRELKHLKGQNYNVVSRNHPAKAEEIVARYKLKSSDNNFLIACSVSKEKSIIEAVKIK